MVSTSRWSVQNSRVEQRDRDRLGRKIRIGYLSDYEANTLDPLAWSGTLYAIQRQLLLEGFEVVHLGHARMLNNGQRKLLRRWKDLRDRLLARLPFLKFLLTQQRQRFMRGVHQKLRQQPCDLILAAAVTDEVVRLETDIPIVYLADATSRVYYPLYRDEVPVDGLDQAIALDYKLFNRSRHLVFPSQWAANSALLDYDIAPDKISVLPFGANLDQIPTQVQVQKQRSRPRSGNRCKLLFCGVKWERKGGIIAYETLMALLKAGIDAELIVVGTKLPEALNHPNVRVVGYLNKASAKDQQVLQDLLWEADFFILPTRGECYGIVCCEASAFGLPTLTTIVGGVPEVVREGRNGCLFPLEATGQDYADKVLGLLQNPDRYAALVTSTRQEYDDRLSWSHWGEGFRSLALQLVGSRPG